MGHATVDIPRICGQATTASARRRRNMRPADDGGSDNGAGPPAAAALNGIFNFCFAPSHASPDLPLHLLCTLYSTGPLLLELTLFRSFLKLFFVF